LQGALSANLTSAKRAALLHLATIERHSPLPWVSGVHYLGQIDIKPQDFLKKINKKLKVL
jgi:hypothetical protein